MKETSGDGDGDGAPSTGLSRRKSWPCTPDHLPWVPYILIMSLGENVHSRGRQNHSGSKYTPIQWQECRTPTRGSEPGAGNHGPGGAVGVKGASGGNEAHLLEAL